MIRDLMDDYAVLQSGYWRVEIDTARPRFVSMRVAEDGLGVYCQEMFEPGLGGESIAETRNGIVRSRQSAGHQVIANEDGGVLHIQGIQLGDFAQMDWKITMPGESGDVLRIEVTREFGKETELVTDSPFGFLCQREFAFWSRPSLRFHHNPADGYLTNYAPYEERKKRRVIGYHSPEETPEFFIHSSPTYPDLGLKVEGGYYHIEQHYTSHVTFGISSRNFSEGPVKILPGKETWILELKPYPQGASAPVCFNSGNKMADRFVPAFFDGYLLSAVACDHEMFGNNPYRHAYAPGAIDQVARGYLITDRRAWSETQGDMEKQWRRHIRRTLKEGRISKERLTILLDSGVWQDACGSAGHEYGAYSLNTLFVTACCHCLLKTGDMGFAGEIYDDLVFLLKPLETLDSDQDGLLENPIPGTPGSPASSYNDCLGIGHKDGYLNAVAHEAYVLFAGLCEALDKSDEASRYRKLAQGIREAYNEQLWDEKTQHYVGWIDVEGTAHDSWYTYINFPAISMGIASPERAKRIMENFVTHPNHHRIFAAGVNLDPITDGSYNGGTPFGIWLNGGVLLGPSAHELFARAVGLGGEGAWVMLNDLMEQWGKDRLCGTPLRDWTRPPKSAFFRQGRLEHTGKNAYTWIDGEEATGAGTEPYLSDGGAILWALYTGVIGIRPDFQGITFIPHLPKALENVEVTIRLMGRNLTVRTKGYGDSLSSLLVDRRRISSNRLIWEDIKEHSVIEITMSKQG